MSRFIGLLLMLAGLLFVFYPQIEKRAFDHEQQQLLDSFEQLGDTDLLEQASTQSEEIDTLEKFTQASDKQSALLEGARGILTINKIDLDMIVFDGTTPNQLSKGAGMIEPAKEFGVNNIGIAGHRAVTKGKQFNRLGELRIDDEIQVTTQDGTYDYVIVDTFVVHQSEVSVLEDAEEPLLTLVTCTPLGKRHPPNRLIVQAQLKQSKLN